MLNFIRKTLRYSDYIFQHTPLWCLFIFLSILLRAPGLWTPILDVDEAQFAGYANALLSGGLPFIDSVDTKPLGIYWFFEVIFALFGRNNMFAVHIITSVWVAATGIFCAKITELFASKRASIYAALLYVLFSTCYLPKFISTSIVVVMMLPLTISIWYFLRAEKTGENIHNFLAGLSFGIACLFKYQAGTTLLAIAFYSLFFRPLYLRGHIRPIPKKAFLLFLSGGLSVGLAFAVYLLSKGVWHDFIFFSLHGSMAYLEAGSNTVDFFRRLFIHAGSFIAFTIFLWYFSLRHARDIIKHLFTSLERSPEYAQQFLIFFWFLFNLIAVVAGRRFFGHYFIQILPALAILTAPQMEIFIQRFVQKPMPAFARTRYTIFWSALIFPAIIAFQLRLFAPQIYQYFGEDHPELYIPVGQYIREHSSPGDHIFVWGFATPIYFFADRDSASRFLWCDWLTGRIAGSHTSRDTFFDTSSYVTKGSWDMLMSDLEKNRPLYIVDTAPAHFHEYGKYPLLNYPLLVDYVDKNYVLETIIDGADLYRRVEK